MFNKVFGFIKKIFTLKNSMLLLLILAVTGVTFYLLTNLWQAQAEKVEAELKSYQAVIIKNETELLSSQLVKFVIQGKTLAKSRIFRSALDGLSSSKKDVVQKAHEDLENFVKVSGFSAGHLFDLNGKLFATTSGQLEKEEASYQESIKKIIETRIPIFSPLYSSAGQLVSELFLPVFPSKAISNTVEPVKIMVLTIPMTEILRSFLASDQSLKYNSNIHLIQQDGAGDFQETVFSYPDNLKLQTVGISLDGFSKIDFGIRTDLYKTKQVFSAATYIPAIRWWVMIETDGSAVDVLTGDYKKISTLIACLGIGTFVFFILTMNFLISSRKFHRKSTELEAELIPALKEKLLLQKICNTIPTPISLKDGETGHFLYINQAFVELTSRNHSGVDGLTDQQVFDNVDAEELSHGDQMISMSGSGYSQELSITKGMNQLTMQVTGVPCSLKQENDAILTVFRDITTEKQATTQSIETRQQIIDALVRAVESVPFLDGHTSLMRLLSLEIAETLLLSDADCATVEAAAILSQVGKTFIPKEIMEKEGKLTPEELLETRKYVEHTCKLLEGIKFDLPITQTIWQMQESLDGSGYPNGLKGKEVSVLAGILGVTNTFSALVQHRAHRNAKTAQEAVDILYTMIDKRFEGSIIEALDAVIQTPSGKGILTASKVGF
ncbi:MAG: PAS sensor protein [Desulfovibrio sp. S3730MH75]|nr:MAG: PAS sensor protein [Desulfovibrio sp. S3730MH75]